MSALNPISGNVPATPGNVTRFRCKVGGEWKHLSAFSNAQQRNLERLGSGSRRVDPAHCGMTCKEHSAGSRSELRCDLCLLVKPLDEFSKNSRRNGEYQCRRCVAWVEIQEPDVTPGPLETGHISPEEEQQQMLRQRFFSTSDFFDDENLKPQAPITAMSSLGLDDSEYAEALETMSISDLLSLIGGSSAKTSTSTNLPPHLRHKAPAGSPTSTSASQGGSLPPHLRDKYRTAKTTMSATSSTAGDVSLPSTLLESDSEGGSIANRSFNAWPPDGRHHRQKPTKSENTDSDTASTSSRSVAATDPNVVGDWSAVPLKNPTPVRKGGWVRGPENRMSATELRESQGEVYPSHISRDVDTQKLIRPLGYDSDSD